MMRGRFVHPLHGEPGLQRYGRDDSEVIWSIHRGDLNITLLDLAEQAGAHLHFHHRLEGVDFDAHVARFGDDRDGRRIECTFSALVGADGAGSSLRAAMQANRAELDAIAAQSAPPDFDNTIAAFDRCARQLARIESVFYNLSSSQTSAELQAVRTSLPLAVFSTTVTVS